MPAISVILPVYNAERYLAEAVGSVLAQTEGDFELIAVDDGSRDGSRAILDKLAAADARVRVVSRANTGIVGALNDGMAAATGEFVARMDGDDVSAPDRFAEQLAHLRANPDCVLVGSRVTAVDPFGCELWTSSHALAHDDIDAQLMRGNGNAVVHPAAMMRRDALERVGRYRKQYEWAEDLDLWLRLAEIGRVANLSDVLLRYRQHPTSVNRTRQAQQVEIIDAAVRDAHRRRGTTPKAGWHYQPPARPARDAELRTWAWKALKAGKPRAARRHAIDAWKESPLSVESWRTLYCAWRGR